MAELPITMDDSIPQQAGPGAGADQLHQQIMNLPCDDADFTYEEAVGYRCGHRDARHAAAQLVAASPAAAAPPWQPIETAPRDGSQYILVTAGRGAWVARWQPVAVSGYQFDQPWRSMMLNHDHIAPTARHLPPTHWMPLPPPPGTASPAAAAGVPTLKAREHLSTINERLAALVNMNSLEARPGHEYLNREMVMQEVCRIRDAAFALFKASSPVAPVGAPTDAQRLDWLECALLL